MGKLFGTDGIRGIVGKDVTCELAKKVGRALVKVVKTKEASKAEILVGMDTRVSSDDLCKAICKGIEEMGGIALNIGVCSTPAVAFLVKEHRLDAGIMISASHNPYNYNGIKIFGSDGFKLSDEKENVIEEMIFSNEKERDSVHKISHEQAKTEYINYIKGAFGVSLKGMRIAIDCANGSASVTAEKIFKELGAQCFMLCDKPDGTNINKVCGSTHLEALQNLVVEKSLDLGIAFDGDADRCLAVDENGQIIDGDYIMAILALRLKSHGLLAKNTVVGTVMTNLGFKKFCENNDINFLASKVGDRYVLEILENGGYSFGGEQSGHLIIRSLATTGDGQLTALALLSHIKESGKSLSTLAAIMKKYPQFTINIEADNDDKKLVCQDEEINKLITHAEKSLKGNGRIIIRPSGTEALIRIMVEDENEDSVEEICRDLSDKIKARLLELKPSVR